VITRSEHIKIGLPEIGTKRYEYYKALEYKLENWFAQMLPGILPRWNNPERRTLALIRLTCTACSEPRDRDNWQIGVSRRLIKQEWESELAGVSCAYSPLLCEVVGDLAVDAIRTVYDNENTISTISGHAKELAELFMTELSW
jgi:hypothetical protein